jgi:hypothetical protein
MNADYHVPLLVTNKHVIAEATEAFLHFSTKAADEADEPLPGKHIRIQVANFNNNWLLHPSPDVDLAALPISGLIEFVTNELKVFPFYKALLVEHVATDLFTKNLLAIEPITMIGYPNGLWDSANNLPIVRKGITATPPYADFEGKPQFMIDCACFPGSSGSPVFLLDVSGYTDKTGNLVVDRHRVKLLGILAAGPIYDAEGEIKMVPAPTTMIPIVRSKLFLNLGICVKAGQLLWFENFIRQQLERELAAGLKPNIRS